MARAVSRSRTMRVRPSNCAGRSASSGLSQVTSCSAAATTPGCAGVPSGATGMGRGRGEGVGLFEQREPLADAGTETFVAAFEPFQHLDAARQAAPLCLEVGHELIGIVAELAEALAFLPLIGQRLAGGREP